MCRKMLLTGVGVEKKKKNEQKNPNNIYIETRGKFMGFVDKEVGIAQS